MRKPKLLPQLLLYFTMLHYPLILAEGAMDQPLMDDWLFQRGEHPGAVEAAFEDAGWERVRLPHDWSIGLVPVAEETSAGGGGFFPTGEGWYRRWIEAPDSWQGQQVLVHFEGSYRNTEVWVNGEKVAERAYGYVPFRADLTPYLKLGEKNLLTVRVDNSRQPNSRWYSGSGLYRLVHLEVRHPLHVPPEGLFVSTSALHPGAATMEVQTEVRNDTAEQAKVRVELNLIGPDDLPVADHTLQGEISPGQTATFKPQLAIGNPQLWSPETPVLYRAVARIFQGGLMTDRQETTFGIREVEYDADEGLLINGKPVVLAGGNVHHDNGPLGAAAYADAEERRVRLLKAAGFNAIRTAHNPPSTAFLEACDRHGMLVIDEAFDAWKTPKLEHDYNEDFDDNWEQDLTAFVRRDRNHPSVIMWSIGNEMFERGSEKAPGMARAMAEVIRSLDSTRPVSAGVNGLGKNGQWSDLDRLFTELDVVGYNYELAAQHATDRERLPERIMYASESFHTEIFKNWKIVSENTYAIGDFVWTALDYLGEAAIGRYFPPDEEARDSWVGEHFPWHGAPCGDIDLTGFRKPVSHYRNIVWDRGETLYMAVKIPAPDGGEWNTTRWTPPVLAESWTWPKHEGEELEVEVYSRHPIVRLYLGRTLVGEQQVSEATEFKADFNVPYSPGVLRVQGLVGEDVVEEFILETAGEPRQLVMKADCHAVYPNHSDLVFVEVTVADAGGRRCPAAAPSIKYSIEGPGEILTIGSSNLTSREPYGANPRKAHEGRAIVVIRALGEPGDILLKASADGLVEDAVSIRSAWPL